MLVKLNEFQDDRGSLTCIDTKKWDQVNISKNLKKFTFRQMKFIKTILGQEKQIIVTKGKIIDFIYNLKTKTLDCTLFK